ncbi:MAG: lysylphosphatidylglycerol synthase transmembrane domain-containing protein [Candidatus Nanopelagicales bacterium]|nr:flippase-like domain-containing protein [Actinomycetes bacterium]
MAPDSDSAIETEFTLAGPIPYIPTESTKAPAPNNGVNPPIIYDGAIKKRIRRPLDLARFAVAISLVLGTIALGYFATSTTAGLDTDIEGGVALLPSLVVLALNVVGGIGSLGLPIAGSISLIVRRRLRQLFDSLVALFLAVTVLSIVSIVIGGLDNPRLLIAMAGSTSSANGSTAPILGGILAFITVARLMSRRPWNVLSSVVMVSLILVTLLSSGIALAGIGFSLAVGWAIGLLTRYALGTSTTRPSGAAVAAAMERGGYPITELRIANLTSRGRRYSAITRNGDPLRITILDRDLEGAGLVNAAWTSLRLRDEPGKGAFNLRKAVEHAALVAYAAQAAGAPVPRLLLATEVGPDSVALVYQQIPGTPFNELTDITDTELDSAWRAIRTLHEHQMSHRALSSRHLLRGPENSTWLLGTDQGSIAASDVAIRLDLAELLCSLAMLTSVERSVSSARRVLGSDAIARALPALQPVALSPGTRKALRKHKGMIIALRDAIVELRPDADTEQIQFQRIKPRTLVMIVVGTIAGYVLLSQLTSVDLGNLFSTANWSWVLGAFGFSLITYAGAAWSLSGFVPEKLSFGRTVLAQVAGDFATLVSPPALGAIAINVRYLQKSGLHPALAAASVGVSQVAAFATHIGLLLAFGIAAGTQADFTFDPPIWAVVGVAAVAVILLALLAVSAVRRLISKRIGPLIKEVVPRMVTIAQRPTKLLEGIGGILLLNLAYVGVLYACVQAFDGSLSIAVVAVVYLAGATIGQAAPTPGGLGAVEAALAAGLTAAGLDAGLAVSAVLLYRLLTFWLPTLPGYWSFNYLTKKNLL